MILLWPFVSTPQSVKPLTIGDKVPDIVLDNLVNYKTDHAKLSDFKANLLILDFWATWCAPCVKSIADFEKLQQQFAGKVQFILATPEQKNKILKFFKNKNIDLPCFVEEKQLKLYFPHNSVPHEVWMQNGKVIAVTYSNTVTAENIQKVLAAEPVLLPEKEFNPSYDRNQPLISGNNGGNGDDIVFHSVITGYLPGILLEGSMNDKEGRFKITALNASVGNLYVMAATKQYGKFFGLKNRLLIEAKQKEKIIPPLAPGYDTSVRPFFYCYELIVPASEKGNAFSYMMQDLNRYFGALYHITCEIEKIKTKCWVLKRVNNSTGIETKNGPSKIQHQEDYELFQNKPFSDFFYSISYVNQNQPYPFVDKTGITGKVDIQLSDSVTDISSLKTYLKKYGFQLSLEESEIKMIVIKNIH
jgi:thiol-disulfide isomerase/thioredoxin